MFASKVSIVYEKNEKMYSAPKICFLSLFCELQNENGFLKHLFFIVLCSYLFSEWKKAASKSHVLFAVYEKRLKKQFFGAEYRFFCKR